LQIWGDSGVIIPDQATAHGGKGIHRRFQASEAIVAVLMRPLAAANIQIGHLAGLAGGIRQALGLPNPGLRRGTVEQIPPALQGRFLGMLYGQGVPTIAHALSRALRGEGENFLLVSASYSAAGFVIGAIEEDDPANPPPSSIAAFFRHVRRSAPVDVVFCLDLKRLAGIFDEAPPG
jgi:hypothetical protein